MTAMFDAHMHDFPPDGVMDAEMLPSVSDADWLQAESMMEDADSQKPQEVDMSAGDLQEFEMRDIGDADVDFGGDYDPMAPDDSRYLFRAEPQDQDIPDASRAPSPSLLQHHTFTPSIHSEQAPHEPDATTEPLVQAEAEPLPDIPTSHQSGEADGPSSTQPQEVPDDHNPPAETVDQATGDAQDTSTISGGSTNSPQLQQQDPPLEAAEYPEPIENTTEVSHVYHNEETHSNDHSISRGPVDYPHVKVPTEHHLTETNNEVPSGHQVTEADDEGLLLDPPPSVLLSYPFDNSRFAFFNLLDDPSAARTPALVHSTTLEDQTESDLIANLSGEAPVEPEHHTQPDELILLFHERFALYYEPLSLIFEALRADRNVNVGGRFDDNIELVISAPELDLTLPEDNIYSREVSLHDLGILHNGCDLSGPLSLRLETISPRFGSRYKAIRDEIVRVVFQQENEERRSQVDPGEGYLEGSLLHESPEGRDQSEAPDEHSADHDLPAPNDPVGESQPQSSEQQLIENRVVEHERDALRSQEVEESEEQAETSTHEHDVSEEYAAYNDDEESHEGDDDQQGYEDAEGEYAEEEEGENGEASYEVTGAEYVEELEHQPDETQQLQDEEQVESFGLGDTNSSLDAVGESLDDIYESVALFATEIANEREATPSTQHVVPDAPTDVQASTSGSVTKDLTGTPELEADLLGEVALHESITFSDAERLISEARSISRSETPRPSDAKRGQDEVIAYEDAVEDENTTFVSELLPTRDPSPDLIVSSSTNHSVTASRAVSTASKRSYDEHELDQVDGADSQHGASSESKRLRVD